MDTPYVFLQDLAAEANVPSDGILSHTLQNDDRSKVILFGFAPGQELSAHHAPFPAMIYFVEGEATLQLGNEFREASAGTFAHMAPNLEHGIKAKTKVVMLLTLLKNPPPAKA
ncbi:MAG: cupin domain-containing protein [Acidobacteriota bacterium]